MLKIYIYVKSSIFRTYHIAVEFEQETWGIKINIKNVNYKFVKIKQKNQKSNSFDQETNNKLYTT
jgi:hypothetical protein